MRLTFVFFLIYVFANAQTSEVIVNQAIETAKAQNITTKSDLTNALKSRGISESEARQLASQKGLSYDEILKNFSDEKPSVDNIFSDDPDTSILEKIEIGEDTDLDGLSSDDIDYIIRGSIDNYFGYNIFENNPYLNKEYLLGNIDEGYLISPGDEIRIVIYGDNSLEVKVTVDRNGNINIKDYGMFFASGMTFKTLKSRLKIYLGKYLSGLVSNPQKTFMDVSLTELKPTKVVVLGQVASPGPHILTTSGSALSALYAAGGVKYSGSLREIVIYRNNKILKKIDLYDYITTGELRDDIKLTNNDIIFVPNRKNTIELKGEVKKSAFYEILENEDLSKLLEYSGGLLPTTQTNKVNIQRIIPFEERSSENIIDRKLITIDYQNLITEDKRISLFDGDQVIFFRILDLESSQVSIDGHVYEPGTFSLESFPTLKSLIFEAGKGFKPDVYYEKVDVYSLVDGVDILNTYDLFEIISESKNVNLIDGDRVIIYNNLKVLGDKTISINGFGTSGATIPWKKNYSVYDFIFSQTSIKKPDFADNLLKTRIDLKSYNSETGRYSTSYYDFNNIDDLKNVILKPYDKIVLYNKNISINTDKKTSIYGYIKNPVTIPLEDEMYVEDLILLSGGYTDSADQNYVNLSRFEINIEDNNRITREYVINIDKDYLLGKKDKPENSFQLKDKDIIVVPKSIGYQSAEMIMVTGEVNLPQTIISEFKNTSFKEIIEKAGGLTDNANLTSSYLIRDGNKINIDLSKVKKEAIFLNRDEIHIESRNGLVLTVGELNRPSNFIWEKNRRAKYYIRNSGGKKRKSSSKTYINYANGMTSEINLFRNPKVLVNSTIFVDKKKEKEKTERGGFLDDFNRTFAIITSTLMTILLTQRL